MFGRAFLEGLIIGILRYLFCSSDVYRIIVPKILEVVFLNRNIEVVGRFFFFFFSIVQLNPQSQDNYVSNGSGLQNDSLQHDKLHLRFSMCN